MRRFTRSTARSWKLVVCDENADSWTDVWAVSEQTAPKLDLKIKDGELIASEKQEPAEEADADESENNGGEE